MTTYAITTLRLSATIGMTLTMTGSSAAIAGIAVGARADRFGRKTMLVLTRSIFVPTIDPAFLVLTAADASPAGIIALNATLDFLFSASIGAFYAFLAEAFPKSVRSSGLALVYAVGVTVFGGTTQFVVAWLIDRTGNAMVRAWYQIAANLLALAGILMIGPHAEVLRERVTLGAAKA